MKSRFGLTYFLSFQRSFLKSHPAMLMHKKKRPSTPKHKGGYGITRVLQIHAYGTFINLYMRILTTVTSMLYNYVFTKH